MSVLTKEELLERIKTKIGEDTSDESLSLIEDVTDTFKDMENKSKDSTDWEKKYKENDEMWRKKYRDRFFSATPKDEDEDIDVSSHLEEPKPLTFDDLFKEN